jgi:vitamin B12 transporter
MRTLLLSACSAMALFAGSAHAQVAEVLIVGYLEEEIPQELARYGVRVETVTAEEILNGGYYDITETLEKQIPGMFIAARGGVFDYVNVSYQGSRTQDILWLVDGVRINNRLYAATTPVDTIPAHMAERIEALEGGQSLFYGTQGIAGAVNMVTRGFSQNPEGMIKGGLNTNNGWHSSGYFSNTFGAHQFVAYVSHDQADGFQPFRDQDYQPTSTDRDRSYEVTTFGGKYGINFTNDLRISTSYQHTDAKLDHSSPKGPAFAFNERDEDILTGKIDYTPSDAFEFFVKGYYHWWDAGFSQANNTNPPSGEFTFFDDDILRAASLLFSMTISHGGSTITGLIFLENSILAPASKSSAVTISKAMSAKTTSC